MSCISPGLMQLIRVHPRSSAAQYPNTPETHASPPRATSRTPQAPPEPPVSHDPTKPCDYPAAAPRAHRASQTWMSYEWYCATPGTGSAPPGESRDRAHQTVHRNTAASDPPPPPP